MTLCTCNKMKCPATIQATIFYPTRYAIHIWIFLESKLFFPYLQTEHVFWVPSMTKSMSRII